MSKTDFPTVRTAAKAFDSILSTAALRSALPSSLQITPADIPVSNQPRISVSRITAPSWPATRCRAESASAALLRRTGSSMKHLRERSDRFRSWHNILRKVLAGTSSTLEAEVFTSGTDRSLGLQEL